MYFIEDKPSAVRELQRMLLIVSQADHTLPTTAIDGIFTDETRLAVLAYQRGRGLLTSGVGDIETFNSLFMEMRRLIDEKNAYLSTVSPESYPLSLGSSGEAVKRLNTDLLSLRRFYKDMPEADIRPYFGRGTDSAVKYMQDVFRILPDGIVTYVIAKRIADEISEREKFPLGDLNRR